MSDCDEDSQEGEEQQDNRSCADDFEILNKIGSGSFGQVFKVRRKQDGNIYVIKDVRISELSKREQLEAINEVDLLAKIDCPFVVKYYDSFLENNNLHIVMEFCNKGDLQRMVKRAVKKGLKSLGEKSTWNIILQILLGLHYLHRMKVLHRDMKSANVFLMKYPNQNYYCVKIGDLGVAKLLDTSTAFAQSLVGTPYYLSPELCADLPYRDKSDVWAFGVILYESCMLTHPFDARNQCALIMKIVQAQMAPIAEHVPVELKNLILWTLQKDPKDRPKIKHILNDRYVREKLEEHHFPVPPELSDDRITDRIAPLQDEERADEKESLKPKARAARTLPIQEHKKTPAGIVTSATQGIPPRGASGRVRGRAESKIVSTKARERYQVKPSPPPKPPRRGSRGISSEEEKSMVEALQAANDIAEDKSESGRSSRRGSRSEGSKEPSWDDAKRILDEIAVNDRLADASATMHESASYLKEADDQYDDETFEQDDTEYEETLAPRFTSHEVGVVEGRDAPLMDSLELSKTASRLIESKDQDREAKLNDDSDAILLNEATTKIRIPSEAKEIIYREQLQGGQHSDGDEDDEDDSTLADDNPIVSENADLWKTAWSQGRGVLNSNRGNYAMEGFALTNNPEEVENIRTRRRMELEKKVHDFRDRTVKRIGETIFNRVYELMSTIMYAPVSENASEDLAALSSTVSEDELKEIEQTLCDTLKGGVQEACEVVFDVKKLLAVESSLDNMISGELRK